MTSFATVRDPSKDQLLTPQNSALVIIDYQPVQVSSLASRSKRELVTNVTALARIGRLYRLPVVLSTVNVATGINQPTIHQITDVLTETKPIDRTSINAWEDEDFVRAVRATGRKKLIMAALWTEVCLVHPGLDAIAEGFEVYPGVDCVGGTPLEGHGAGLRGLELAGAKAARWVAVFLELRSDWAPTARGSGGG